MLFHFALIVGIGAYQDERIPKLKYTHADAQAFYDLLTDPQRSGFKKENVRLLLDADSQDAELADLGFGEDYELLAAVADPEDFAVIGHCGEGEGVELLLDGEPHELPAWEHFRS